MPNTIHTCTHLNHQSIPIPVGLVGAGGSETARSINAIAKPVDASTSAAARTVVILLVIVDLNL